MFELTLKAQSLKELHKLICDAASEIETKVDVQPTLPVQCDEPKKRRGKKPKDEETEVDTPAAPMPVFVPPAPPVTAAPVGLPSPFAAPPPPVVAPVVAQLVQPAPPPPPKKGFEYFKDNVVSIFANLINEKKIDQAYVDSLKEYFKVSEIWQAFSDDNKLKELYQNFLSYGFVEAE
jgi:hypothetical protein